MKLFDGERQTLGTISFDIGKVKSFYFDENNILHIAYQDNDNANVVDVRAFQNDAWESANTIHLPE